MSLDPQHGGGNPDGGPVVEIDHGQQRAPVHGRHLPRLPAVGDAFADLPPGPTGHPTGHGQGGPYRGRRERGKDGAGLAPPDPGTGQHSGADGLERSRPQFRGLVGRVATLHPRAGRHLGGSLDSDGRGLAGFQLRNRRPRVLLREEGEQRRKPRPTRRRTEHRRTHDGGDDVREPLTDRRARPVGVLGVLGGQRHKLGDLGDRVPAAVVADVERADLAGYARNHAPQGVGVPAGRLPVAPGRDDRLGVPAERLGRRDRDTGRAGGGVVVGGPSPRRDHEAPATVRRRAEIGGVKLDPVEALRQADAIVTGTHELGFEILADLGGQLVGLLHDHGLKRRTRTLQPERPDHRFDHERSRLGGHRRRELADAVPRLGRSAVGGHDAALGDVLAATALTATGPVALGVAVVVAVVRDFRRLEVPGDESNLPDRLGEDLQVPRELARPESGARPVDTGRGHDQRGHIRECGVLRVHLRHVPRDGLATGVQGGLCGVRVRVHTEHVDVGAQDRADTGAPAPTPGEQVKHPAGVADLPREQPPDRRRPGDGLKVADFRRGRLTDAHELVIGPALQVFEGQRGVPQRGGNLGRVATLHLAAG